ncbi:MAG: selenocysteine-specific translation elongation factor [Janthinobacterium lividum]
MIVGTAGHIDHGKTSLVKALTGVDADRLPEEKRRGITIELGYASMETADGGQIGFIDMPGHEKLVRTMVAGASGIDYALLLVAADDGIMPQTLEHLSILTLLGITRGAAVLTKIDRVDAALLAQRELEVRALLDRAGCQSFPLFKVAALRGDGVETLRTMLRSEAARLPDHGRETAAGDGTVEAASVKAADVNAGFRMALDRVFTLDGIGTIVAGSIAAGSVRIGDMLCLAHARTQVYRVRSLHVHNKPVQQARGGQRCAVGLAGLERGAAERGQILCDPAIVTGSQRFDAWLQIAASEARALRSGSSVHLHIGTQDCLASVAVLGQPSIAPAAAGLVQLVLQQTIHCWQGERFVLRDASGSRTLAGGVVLDADAPARYRQTAQRLAYLQSQRQADPAARLHAAVLQSPYGIDGAAWLRDAGLLDWPFDPASVEGASLDARHGWMIDRTHLAATATQLEAALRAFHQQAPDDIGPDLQRARRLVAPRLPATLWLRLVERLGADGSIVVRNGFLHLPEHGIRLQAAEKVVAERALPLLLAGAFDPPWVRDIAGTSGLLESQVRQVLARMSKGGDVYQIVKDLYYHPGRVMELAAIVRTLAGVPAGTEPCGKPASITAASFRDATGLGRKRAIQILEFFDRIGFLRRVGDAHLLRPGTTLFLPPAVAPSPPAKL